MSPYERGHSAAAIHTESIERFRTAPPDPCPYPEGTEEEREYRQGWQDFLAAHRARLA